MAASYLDQEYVLPSGRRLRLVLSSQGPIPAADVEMFGLLCTQIETGWPGREHGRNLDGSSMSDEDLDASGTDEMGG